MLRSLGLELWSGGTGSDVRRGIKLELADPMAVASTESRRAKNDPFRGVSGGSGPGRCRGDDVVEEVGGRREREDAEAEAL